MPLIKCPDCAETVSDRAEVCLKCGRPIAERGGVQTIQKTSKKLKACVLVSYVVFFASIFLMILGGARDSNEMMIPGFLGFVVGGLGMGVLKLRIWWEHE